MACSCPVCLNHKIRAAARLALLTIIILTLSERWKWSRLFPVQTRIWAHHVTGYDSLAGYACHGVFSDW